MSIVKPEHVILDLVVEDSYAFPEVMSRVQAALSSLSPGDAKEIARKAVAEMLREGLIAVTRLESPQGPEVALQRQEAEAALADDLSWLEASHWRPHFRLVATAAGEEAYRQN